LASDRFISYGTWKWFDAHRKTGAQPTFRFLFSRIPPVPPTKPSYKPAPFVMPPLIGAPHASEIPYCLGNLDLVTNLAYTAEDYLASAAAQQYFANFIKSGNPNGEGLPEWPAAGAREAAPAVMNLDVRPKAAASTVEPRYEFLDRSETKAK
jgi:para-nitrobenzyl esterase